MSDYSKASWSFISENSFGSLTDQQHRIDILNFSGSSRSESSRNSTLGESATTTSTAILGSDAYESYIPHSQFMVHTPYGKNDKERKQSTEKQMNQKRPLFSKKSTVGFTLPDTHTPDGPQIVTTYLQGSQNSLTPIEPMQILEEQSNRNRSVSSRNRSVTSNEYFNHALYGSLRQGNKEKLFSASFYGLAITAAASGFMMPFLELCYEPMLCVYLNFDERQCEATHRMLILPGVLSFFLGLLSDFYPLWHLHRKAYVVGGWLLAYLSLMSLVFLVTIDDATSKQSPESAFRMTAQFTYLIFMMGTTFGVTMASVASFALVIELSQREPVHERGAITLSYMVTREVLRLAANIVAVLIMDYSPAQAEAHGGSTNNPIANNSTFNLMQDKDAMVLGSTSLNFFDRQDVLPESLMSLKSLLLLMSFVTLAPIPIVLLKMDEEKREVRVDSVDRTNLIHHMWNIVQQKAVWRVILFTGCLILFQNFRLQMIEHAVIHWANVDTNLVHVGQIPLQILVICTLVIYQKYLINYSWIKLALFGVCSGVIFHLLGTIPIILNLSTYSVYYLAFITLMGPSIAIILIVTTLPVIEITENGIEGATTGLVTSYTVLIATVTLSISKAISSSKFFIFIDWSKWTPKELHNRPDSIQGHLIRALGASAVINLLAIVPIVYLLPRQKLEAQHMRTYGEFHPVAGCILLLLFVLLLGYVSSMNIADLYGV